LTVEPDLDLRETLKLERLEVNLFRGVSPERSGPRIFGGQVIAQSLLAAYETVEDRVCHSLHAYFLRPGDPRIPIIFEVDRSRDGQSFTTRRVIAVQHGRQIFNMAASFQVQEPGFEHQSEMPAGIAGPDGYSDIHSVEADMVARRTGERPVIGPSPIDMRFVLPKEREALRVELPVKLRAWFRARSALGDDLRWQQVALAYASDMGLLAASLLPHSVVWNEPGMQTASLDHAIWFHRPSDMSRWHLFDMDSPSASGARGFNRGSIYSEDGTLVASCVQEGLIRRRGG
jgi:acyl-CoA thioesterase-2